MEDVTELKMERGVYVFEASLLPPGKGGGRGKLIAPVQPVAQESRAKCCFEPDSWCRRAGREDEGRREHEHSWCSTRADSEAGGRGCPRRFQRVWSGWRSNRGHVGFSPMGPPAVSRQGEPMEVADPFAFCVNRPGSQPATQPGQASQAASQPSSQPASQASQEAASQPGGICSRRQFGYLAPVV